MTTSDFDPADPIGALVRDADAAAPPPPVPSDLAERVRVRGRRRRQRRRAVAGSVVALMLAMGIGLLLRSGRDTTPPQVAKIERPVAPGAPKPIETPEATPVSLASLEQLRADADARLASVTRLVALERRRDQLRRLNAIIIDSTVRRPDRVAALRAEAALTLVGQADRLRSRANDPADALATYRRVAELFPDTPSASVARQRIAQLQSELKPQEIRS